MILHSCRPRQYGFRFVSGFQIANCPFAYMTGWVVSNDPRAAAKKLWVNIVITSLSTSFACLGPQALMQENPTIYQVLHYFVLDIQWLYICMGLCSLFGRICRRKVRSCRNIEMPHFEILSCIYSILWTSNVSVLKCWWMLINSSPPSVAHMRQWFRPALV